MVMFLAYSLKLPRDAARPPCYRLQAEYICDLSFLAAGAPTARWAPRRGGCTKYSQMSCRYKKRERSINARHVTDIYL